MSLLIYNHTFFIVFFFSSFPRQFLLVNYFNDKLRKLADQSFSPSPKRGPENQAVASVTIGCIAYSIIIRCRFTSLESSQKCILISQVKFGTHNFQC